jgi:hypothetical protein
MMTVKALDKTGLYFFKKLACYGEIRFTLSHRNGDVDTSISGF